MSENRKNSISCDVCMDLMPLVKDGIASEDSRNAVEQHIETCEDCKMMYGRETPVTVDEEKAFHKFRRELQIFTAMFLMFGMFFGIGLTAGSEMFYNTLIMPVLGILGYAIFKWKALYTVPTLLFVTHALINVSGLIRGKEHLDLYSLFFWTLLYSIFAVLGVLISGLVHFALKKAEGKKKALRIAGFLIAGVLITGICIFANSLVGNPVSRALAKRTAKLHLAEKYSDTDFYVERVSYDFKGGYYYAHIKAPDSTDRAFSLYIDMDGTLRYDTYESAVADGSNTAMRLGNEYRKLTDAIFDNPLFPFETDIAYGDLEFISQDWEVDAEKVPSYGLVMEDLIPDQMYDVAELGRKAGHLVVYIDDETVTVERAAEMMLEIKRLMEDGGAPFYTMDFVLQLPKPADGKRTGERIDARGFLCSDIYEEGMVERVRAADEAAKAYYAEKDAENAKQQ